MEPLMYKEIEFVCVNSYYENATPLERQERLYDALQALPGVFVYRQDFTNGDEMQVMMAAVLIDPSQEAAVLRLAAEHGVEIDLNGEVHYTPEEFAWKRKEVESGRIEGYMPPPPCKPNVRPHQRPRGPRI
jgi:hypothetical protein